MARRPELDEFMPEAQRKAFNGICEGSCEEHYGEVKAVRVFGEGGCDWGWFSYCEEARREDTENRNMTLEEA